MTWIVSSSPRGLVLGCALTLAACSDPPGTESETESGTESGSSMTETDTESETSEAPEYEPVLDDRPCGFSIPAGRSADCYTLFVPLDRADLEAGAVALPVAVLHPAGEATRPPVVYLHGGPGGEAFDYADRWFSQPLSEDGDVIVFDQRGSGQAVPSLDCGEIEDAWYAVFETVAPPAAEIEILRQAYTDCRARLGAQTDLDQFDTEAVADDVEDLRRALGLETWSLYGVSYGTRVALAVMRRHGDAVRNVVLDSVYPPELGGEGWMLDSIETALQRLIEGCLAEAGCGATFPDLATDLETALANLDAMPYTLGVEDDGGVVHELSLTGADFYAGMFNALYDVDLIPLVPFLIFSAANGDYSFLVDLAEQSIPALTSSYEGARLSIDCADGGALIDAGGLASTIDDYPSFSTMFGAYAPPFCELWGVEAVPEAFLDPVVSEIPTLLLAGEYDPVTPVSQSELALDGLGNGELYVFPGIGHGVSFDSDCGAQMTRAFARDSSVDPSCWAGLSETTF